MSAESFDPDARDWRLRADVAARLEDRRRLLSVLHRHLRDPGLLGELEVAIPGDTVMTHDAGSLFVYATDRALIGRAREAIEAVLAHDSVTGQFAVAHWSEQLDEWVDPEDHTANMSAHVQDAGRIQTRTLVASTGKEIRAEFEQSLQNWASELGLELQIVEHPHLLTSQVGFTVSGPARKLDEFAEGLRAEERATIRTERAVITSPL
jgi:hypothetical protein